MIDVAWMTRGGQIFRAPDEMFKRWHELPYGMWTCADGRQVLFNRFYEPIQQRRPGCPPEPANSKERVKFCRQEWFYGDEHTEIQMRALAAAALVDFLSLLPRAARIPRHLLSANRMCRKLHVEPPLLSQP
jgi:hypothetical protein